MQARRAAAVRVCVDFGGSSTCVALAVGGRLPQVVLVDGASLLPSAVFAEHDGTLLVGAEALRKAEVDPTRCEPHPKRHLDEGRLLLGDAVVEVLDVVTAVLDRAVTEARGVAGGAVVDELVLTHPAQWGALRTRLLRQAGVGLAAETLLCQEPVAAAMFHAARREMPAGAVFAVLDLGGTTVHASVLRCEPAGGFTVLATRGDPHFGGDDLDELMIELAREGIPADRQAQWRELLAGDDLARRSSLRVLRADARSAREALSAGVYADLPLPSPFPDAHITRAGLEAAMAPELDSVTELLLATLADAGVAPERLLDVLLVGGASRIPLMSRLVYQRTGVLPSTLDQAETVVALGALLAGPEPGVAAVSTGSQAPQRVPDAGIAQTLGPATGYRRRATGHAPSRATGSGPNPNAPRWRDTYVATPRSAARRFAPLAAGLVVVALVGVLLVLRPWAGTGRSSGSAEPVGTAQRIAAFDYAFRAPAGWTRTDEDSTALRIRIAPEAAQHGADAVSVQEFRLSASSDGAARDGVLGKLRTLVTGKGYTDFNARAGLAGRSVAYYRGSADGATVDWYVLFNGRVQVSVGCQFTPSGAALVRSVCRQVVGSMRMGHR